MIHSSGSGCPLTKVFCLSRPPSGVTIKVQTSRYNHPATHRRHRARLYRFVSLDEALRDAAYASPDGYIGKFGPSWLRRWADGLGKKLSVRGQPDPELWIMRRYQALQHR